MAFVGKHCTAPRISSTSHCTDLQPTLTTTHGRIRGQKRTSIYDDVYYSFEAIPYAQPPLGELRFKAPVPSKPWSSVLNCTEIGNKPLQNHSRTGEIYGNEDCLTLNVYCKKLQSDKPLPVLVYIFGGAYRFGDATRESLGPDYFMHENVILVTLNYRVGPLGFLQFKDPDLKIPGNAGLKDMVLALRWFKSNCINFNGDPNNITLFGVSSGSASVHYMMLTKQTEGLFHKAILTSGTVLNEWAHSPQGEHAYRLAKHNGFEGPNNDKQVFEFLNKIEGTKLVQHDLMTDEDHLNAVLVIFGPTTESYIGEDCIVPVSPREMLHNAWTNGIPLIIGGTSFEGLESFRTIKANPGLISIIKRHPEYLVPFEVRQGKDLKKRIELGKQILKVHLGEAELNLDNVMMYYDILSYRQFWHGIYRTILARLKYASAPTYVYRFDFDSPTFNYHCLNGQNVNGVAHADEVSYLFFVRNAYKLKFDSDEYRTIRRVVGMRAAFALNSNPNCNEIKPANWKPIEKYDPNKILNISNNVTVMELPEAKKLAFWNSMYKPEELI